jgi:uncharacterized membrane protein YedE/YeeE
MRYEWALRRSSLHTDLAPFLGTHMKPVIRIRSRSGNIVFSLVVAVSTLFVFPVLLVLAFHGWTSALGYASSHLNGGIFSLTGGLIFGIISAVSSDVIYRRRHGHANPR